RDEGLSKAKPGALSVDSAATSSSSGVNQKLLARSNKKLEHRVNRGRSRDAATPNDYGGG
ncbi:MAG: hypothetical protein AB7W37_14615, partial [Syntrophobacteraceae bacterium]